MWYTYSGGYNSTISNFSAGSNGDVLYLPNGAANAVRYGNTLYVYGNGGGVLTVNTAFDYTGKFMYSYDGSSVVRAAIVNSGDSSNVMPYSDDTPVYIGNGLTNLYTFYSSNKAIRLDSGLYPGVKDVTGSYLNNNLSTYESGNNILFGDAQNNVLRDGKGNSTLFGGAGGVDVLIGEAGADCFIFGKGGGIDIILDAENEDTILLYNVNPGEVSFQYDSANDAMALGFNDGSALTVLSLTNNYTTFSYAMPDFLFADGSRLWYNKYNGTWNSISYDAAEDFTTDWGNANTFYGTADADNIFIGKAGGNDLIFNAAQNDTIHFCDVSLSDIVSTSVSENSIAVAFNTGEVAMVGTTENISPTFKLASGESYVYNRESGAWQQT